jgi:hypothetical protein
MSEPPPGAVLITNSAGRVGVAATTPVAADVSGLGSVPVVGEGVAAPPHAAVTNTVARTNVAMRRTDRLFIPGPPTSLPPYAEKVTPRMGSRILPLV